MEEKNNMDKCQNKECRLHLLEMHAQGCILTGKNKCKDIMHTRTCWSKEDLRILKVVLDNYFPEKCLEE